MVGCGSGRPAMACSGAAGGRGSSSTGRAVCRATVSSLFSDRRGDLRVGASGGVALVYLDDVLPITPAQGLAAPIALAVMEDRRGALWVGSFCAG